MLLSVSAVIGPLWDIQPVARAERACCFSHSAAPRSGSSDAKREFGHIAMKTFFFSVATQYVRSFAMARAARRSAINASKYCRQLLIEVRTFSCRANAGLDISLDAVNSGTATNVCSTS